MSRLPTQCDGMVMLRLTRRCPLVFVLSRQRGMLASVHVRRPTWIVPVGSNHRALTRNATLPRNGHHRETVTICYICWPIVMTQRNTVVMLHRSMALAHVAPHQENANRSTCPCCTAPRGPIRPGRPSARESDGGRRSGSPPIFFVAPLAISRTRLVSQARTKNAPAAHPPPRAPSALDLWAAKAQARPVAGNPPGPPQGGRRVFTDPATGLTQGGIQKTSYSHEAMADLILGNPAIDQNEIARFFGYTPGWVSQVIASDAFQAYLVSRRDKIIDPVLRGAVEESFRGLVLQSIAILRRKMDSNPSDQLTMDVFKNSARALGYGARVQVEGSIHHSHSLLGLLTALPPASRVVEALPSPPAPE